MSATDSLLVSRAARPADTLIEAQSLTLGGPSMAVIAAVLLADGAEDLIEIAYLVHAAGADALHIRAALPPIAADRSHSLKRAIAGPLSTIRQNTGLPVIMTVLAPDELNLLADVVDLVHINAEQMQDFRLLDAVGRTNIPALLTRHPGATIEEWLCAAEYILVGGNGQVGLCEGGLRTCEPLMQRSFDPSSLTLLRDRSHLPVLANPCEAAGNSLLVPPLALASVVAGAQALVIHVQPDFAEPSRSLPAALTCTQFAALSRQITELATYSRMVITPAHRDNHRVQVVSNVAPCHREP